MLSKRQEAFRADYRERVAPLYSGPLHVFMIYAIGLSGIWYFVQQIHQPTLIDFLIVPATFLAANIFEWWIHRYVMHRPRKGFMGIYKRHTLAHHQFFTDQEWTIDTTRDYRITFFPPYALVAFMTLSIAPAWVASQIWSTNAAWLLMCTTAGIYLNYEFFHLCCHLKEGWFVRTMPFVNTIRRHHVAHHNTAIMMEKNFNLTYPIADWLFATSDLNRGVLGHVFNGYDTAHVKTDLKKTRAATDDPRAAMVRA
ncbi:MAG: fatty acid hydroxylase family protein [Proteobacteria bacterium]|nr:fatty acid hydroxylase family protein [Pseudomonadota bacterium]